MKKTTRLITIAIMTILLMAVAAVATFASEGGIVAVNLSAQNVKLNEGQSKGLGVSASAYGMTQNEITSAIKNGDWESSNTNVATVSNGTVKAKNAGTAVVTVEVEGKEASCKITVNKVAPTKQNTTAAYTQLNKYRKAKKLKALKRDANLEKIALQRAQEMAHTGKFSHTRPNGKSGLTLIKGKKAKGENIAMGQKTCSEVSKAWYKSTGHRKNMLRKNFKKVGIAGYTYKGVTYWAQVFSS